MRSTNNRSTVAQLPSMRIIREPLRSLTTLPTTLEGAGDQGIEESTETEIHNVSFVDDFTGYRTVDQSQTINLDQCEIKWVESEFR